MNRQDVVALFEKRQQAWDQRDAAALAADHTEDGLVESPLAGGTARGRLAIEKLYDMYMSAFGDMKLEQDELLIDGDRVALLARVSGTDTGGFMSMPPSGRQVRFPTVFFYELRDGRIARERRIYDFTGVLVQVGLLKAKPV